MRTTYTTCLFFRLSGNQAFREGDLELALAQYEFAINHCAGLEKCELGLAQEAEVHKLYLNKATTLGRLGQLESAFLDVERAIRLCPDYAKVKEGV